jgi:hypothetical protein
MCEGQCEDQEKCVEDTKHAQSRRLVRNIISILSRAKIQDPSLPSLVSFSCLPFKRGCLKQQSLLVVKRDKQVAVLWLKSNPRHPSSVSVST